MATEQLGTRRLRPAGTPPAINCGSGARGLEMALKPAPGVAPKHASPSCHSAGHSGGEMLSGFTDVVFKQFEPLSPPHPLFGAAQASPLRFPTPLPQPVVRERGRETWGKAYF